MRDMITNRLAMQITAVCGALAVGLGAFGAHELKAVLEQNHTGAIWEKAVFYHFIHTVVMLVLTGRQPFHCCTFTAFLLGIIVFSGSLYILAVTNLKWLGAITPIGGTAFIVGWILLLIAAGKKSARPDGPG
jgi:Uncharacterized small membrane protein